VPARVISVPDLESAEREGGDAARDPAGVAVVESPVPLPEAPVG